MGNREDLLTRFAANEDDLYILGNLPEGVEAETARDASIPASQQPPASPAPPPAATAPTAPASGPSP